MRIANDTTSAEATPWKRTGSIAHGGTVFALAISPIADVPRYWAATGCGVFISPDAGHTWIQNLSGLTTPLLSALSVAHNGALFAGSLEGDLFASFDFGKTWQAGMVPVESKATVTSIVPSPRFQSDGACFAATDGGGLLVSRNSGKSWEDSSFGLEELSVLALAAPTDWSRREVMFAATLAGVYISQNGGRAWRTTDLMMEEDTVATLSVSPGFEEDRTVFAGTEGGSLYRSLDGGRHWDLVHAALGVGPVNTLWIAPDFAESGMLVAGVGSHVQITHDRGETWQDAGEMPSSVLCLAGNQDVVLVGMHDAGIQKSKDRGATWASSSEGLSARGFSRLIATEDNLYALGPQEGIWVSEDSGASWQNHVALAPYYPISAMAVTLSKVLLAASQESGILRSEDDGQSWSVVSDVTGVQALAVTPAQALALAGTTDGKLLASKDAGRSWEAVASPCEGQEILSIVASPTFEQDHTLFMGTSIPTVGAKEARVALWRSTNGGADWRQVTTQVTTARWIDIALPINVTETVAEQAVLATGPYCLRPLRRAKDVWISSRVQPQGANTLSVVAIGEIDEGGLLFAATGAGIYRSIDGGRTWQAFTNGVGTQSFINIVARAEGDTTRLYALTLGGSLWEYALS
ncbi:MAG: WD40/YVTN/BNR-like repeat-containing protein [Anaerolineae bacterium]